MADAAPPLLDPKFLARLEQLELVSRKIFLGRLKGERRSKRKGRSVEFADYRNYVVGDDLRFLILATAQLNPSDFTWRASCEEGRSGATASRRGENSVSENAGHGRRYALGQGLGR
jgi:hypothetical protein